jgi:hypothetical protein
MKNSAPAVTDTSTPTSGPASTAASTTMSATPEPGMPSRVFDELRRPTGARKTARTADATR